MGGGRCRFKTSYSEKLKGGNILRACDGECEAGAGLPCKPGCSTFRHETSSLSGTARRTSSLSSCLRQGANLERSVSKLTGQTYQSCKEPSYTLSWICSVRLHKTCRLISPLPQLNQKFNYIYRIIGISNTFMQLYQTSFHHPAFWVICLQPQMQSRLDFRILWSAILFTTSKRLMHGPVEGMHYDII